MTNRQFFDVELRVASGSRFQPTGFPDIGPATFRRPSGKNDDGSTRWEQALLVESAQSIANWLERVGWDEGAGEPANALSGLPHVRVLHAEDGRFLTSSRLEAHRLASAFVKDSELDGVGMREVLRDRLGLRDDTPLAPRDIAAAVFSLDPLCLLHGVFFAEKAKVWPGQPRIARAITGFIEASEVEPAQTGGVKKDSVRHSKAEGMTATEGYGFVPFHRTEWTAARIEASFSIDLGQLRSYGLGDDATALLAAMARWEIRSFLDDGLRLRTACDFEPVHDEIVDRAGVPLPSAAELEPEIKRLVDVCAPALGGGRSIDVVWSPKKAKG